LVSLGFYHDEETQMAIIIPTVGRVVHYYPYGKTQVNSSEQPCAASIAHVHPDGTINIGYLDSNGEHHYALGVRLMQDGEPFPESGERFCCWMPYQVGQAAKTEQAERVARAAGQGYGTIRDLGK
jgi:hypothetical protein